MTDKKNHFEQAPENAPTLHDFTVQASLEGMVRFGHYEVIEELGQGGMGKVYRVRDQKLQREVALKILHAQGYFNRENAQRFLLETRAIAQLSHPNIVRLHELGEEQGILFFTMDYIQGNSLHDLIKKKKIGIRKGAEIIEKTARAIHHAHKQGIIHRDLKPTNIIVNDKWEPCIMDFGLAKMTNEKSQITRSGVAMGTPAYMSPEQADGRRRMIDARTDVYSLGAMLYEILTGRPPFFGTTVEILVKLTQKAPMSPRKINKKVTHDLEAICLKAMDKNKRQRYKSAQEMADDLQRFLKGQRVMARQKLISRRSAVFMILGALLLIMVPAAFFLQNKNNKTIEDTPLQTSAPQTTPLPEQLSILSQEYAGITCLLDKYRQQPPSQRLSLSQWETLAKIFARICDFAVLKKSVLHKNNLQERVFEDLNFAESLLTEGLRKKWLLNKHNRKIYQILEKLRNNQKIPDKTLRLILERLDSFWKGSIEAATVHPGVVVIAGYSIEIDRTLYQRRLAQTTPRMPTKADRFAARLSYQRAYNYGARQLKKFIAVPIVPKDLIPTTSGIMFYACSTSRLLEMGLAQAEKKDRDLLLQALVRFYDWLFQIRTSKSYKHDEVLVHSWEAVCLLLDKIMNLPDIPNKRKIEKFIPPQPHINDYIFAAEIASTWHSYFKDMDAELQPAFYLSSWPLFQRIGMLIYQKGQEQTRQIYMTYKFMLPHYNRRSLSMIELGWSFYERTSAMLNPFASEPYKWIGERKIAVSCRTWCTWAMSWQLQTNKIYRDQLEGLKRVKRNPLEKIKQIRIRLKQEWGHKVLRKYLKHYFSKR